MRNVLEKQQQLLSKMYADFNERLFYGGLSDVAITIQSKGRKNCYGWFTLDKVWSNKDEGSVESFCEINISAEYTDRGIEGVASTLIHEMVHFSNLVNGVKDCNPKTQNHNKNFKEKAESVGLEVTKTKNGWSETSLSNELKELIKSLNYEDCFDLARITLNNDKKEKEKKKQNKYKCECGIEIKTTKELDIICAKCNSLFDNIND